jgi:uncharacterized protein (DUF1810 family)
MPHNLNRFLMAQESSYDRALAEIKSGTKQTHWMWYIFPQLFGLGYSANATFYGISGIPEAQAYLEQDLLSQRLIEITEAVLAIQNKSAEEIFGYPDYLKFQSSMSLFHEASQTLNDPKFDIFKMALEKYYKDSL